MLSANQIVGFFDHQYFWKESVDILDLVHGDNHHGMVAYETATFLWVWPNVPLIKGTLMQI